MLQPFACLQEFSLCIASSALNYQLCVNRVRMGAHSSPGRVLGNPAPRDRIGQSYSVGNRGGRYVLIIHFYVESGQKMIQFNIQFKVESKIFIQKIIQFKKFKNYSKMIQFKKIKKLLIQIGKIIPA